MAKRLDVIHDCRAHIETKNGREIRWFDPGITPFALQRFDQPGFFATNISARAAIDVNLYIESGAEDVTPKEIMFACFFDGAFEDLRALRKFASYINVGRTRIQRETRDQDSFEQLMRVLVDDVAVLKRAWFGFIRVADQIDRLFLIGLDEAPLHAAREPGAPATAQPGVLNSIDNFAARHRQRLFQLFVTAITQVTIDIRRPIFASDIFKNEAMLKRMRWMQSRIAERGLPSAEKVGYRIWIDVFAQLFADHAHWRGAAACQTFDKLDAVISIGTHRDGIVHPIARAPAFNSSRRT